MLRKNILILCIFLIFAECATYVYYGQITSEDSAGEIRDHFIYWTRTTRVLGFDECSEVIRLCTEHSYETIDFKETEDGIIFPRSYGYKKVIFETDTAGPYGKILDVKKVSELKEGILRLVIYCEFDSTDFTTGDHHTLKAREAPYEFDIVRKKSTEFEGGIPKSPEHRQ